MPKKHKVPKSRCPGCHHKLTAATNVDDASGPPRKGDLTFCRHCGVILTFTKKLKVKYAVESDLQDLDEGSRVMLTGLAHHASVQSTSEIKIH